MRVLIVDDHPLFRDGLTALLATQPELEIVGEAGDARQACALADRTAPDLVTVDLRLPGLGGLSLVRELMRRAPGRRVVVLSMYEDARQAARALAAGAAGYVVKREPPAAIVEALRRVAAGGVYITPSLADAALAGRDAADAGDGRLATLTSRERELFDLLIRGFSTATAATELGISIKTVETHRANIHRKLGIHSVGELIRLALHEGLALD